jgi:hypothetical protein
MMQPKNSTQAIAEKALTKQNRRFLSATTPEGIRTPNPRFRRPMLYPIELRVHCSAVSQDMAQWQNWQRVSPRKPLAMALRTD